MGLGLGLRVRVSVRLQDMPREGLVLLLVEGVAQDEDHVEARQDGRLEVHLLRVRVRVRVRLRVS